jgi:hypothetical protein
MYFLWLAEAVRFELTNGRPLPVFKTGAFNHSATLPSKMRGDFTTKIFDRMQNFQQN